MNTRFLTDPEIRRLRNDGLHVIGENVKIARTAVIDTKELIIGDNTIIHDFCILTGKIQIGKYCHIAHKVHLSGHHGISIGDFCTISANTQVYTESDDHKGDALVGPQITNEHRSVYAGPVLIQSYVNISANCIILPKSRIDEGVWLQLRSNCYSQNLESWSVYRSEHSTGKALYIRPRNKGQVKLGELL